MEPGRAADVVADVPTVCYTLGRKAFTELLGPIEDVWRYEALRRVPVLFALTEKQLFDLAHCMKNHSIAANQMVFRQGDPGGCFSHLLNECVVFWHTPSCCSAWTIFPCYALVYQIVGLLAIGGM